jgi:hypothetical protein
MAKLPNNPIAIPGTQISNGNALTETEVDIINSRFRDHGIKAPIPTIETLADLYNASLPALTSTFDAFIDKLHQKAQANVDDANCFLADIHDPDIINNPTGAAFNNCNGAWSEFGFAAYSWNSLAKKNRTNRINANGGSFEVYVYIKLPNRNSADNDWTTLLRQPIQQAMSSYPANQGARITDPTSYNHNRNFEMSSSNPDAVILKFDNVTFSVLWNAARINTIDPFTDIGNLGSANMEALDSLFSAFKSSVLPSQNLQCFLSIKRSTRPDRRYQWVREGDHVKTVLHWIYASNSLLRLDPALTYPDLNGKFFAISTEETTDQDRETMNIGLAGSIVQPALEPVWAVDKLYECLKFSDVDAVITDALSFH